MRIAKYCSPMNIINEFWIKFWLVSLKNEICTDFLVVVRLIWIRRSEGNVGKCQWVNVIYNNYIWRCIVCHQNVSQYLEQCLIASQSVIIYLIYDWRADSAWVYPSNVNRLSEKYTNPKSSHYAMAHVQDITFIGLTFGSQSG